MDSTHATNAADALRHLRSPFTDPERRAQFEELVTQYRLRDATLFAGMTDENRSSRTGEAFWRGWHSERFVWGRESKLWIPYRAGRLIRKALSPKKPPTQGPVRSWQRRAANATSLRKQA